MADATYPARGLHGRVVHDLGLRIVAGRYPPGEALPNEDDLCAELGVSRSVVREAVKVLAGKGLVEVRPRTGTRVRGRNSWHLLDPDVVGWQFEDVAGTEDLREVHEVRFGIAPTAARLAALRRTDEEIEVIEAHLRRIESAEAEPEALRTADLDFHGAVVAAAHNTLLLHVNAVVRVALEAAAPSAAAGGEMMPRRRAVADAIRNGQPDQAAAEMRRLLAGHGELAESGDGA